MNAADDPLWQAIEALELDSPGVALTFSQRLARENGWSHAFANRVVTEYKRFLWLAMRAGHPVTPSDEVDQAWHLHLAYTESYWTDLCGRILGRPLHHGPTKGGEAEDAKFHDWYGRTKDSYARCFAASPPPEIWPSHEARFHARARFQRVDTSRVWMLPKVVWRHRARAAALALGAILASGVLLASCTGKDGIEPIWIIIGSVIIVGLIAIARSNDRDKKRKDRSSGCTTSGCGADGCGSNDGGSGCGGGGGCGGD